MDLTNLTKSWPLALTMIPLHYRLALTCTVTYPKRQIHFLSCFVTELNEIWSDDGPGEDLCTHNTHIFFRFNVGTNSFYITWYTGLEPGIFVGKILQYSLLFNTSYGVKFISVKVCQIYYCNLVLNLFLLQSNDDIIVTSKRLAVFCILAWS